MIDAHAEFSPTATHADAQRCLRAFEDEIEFSGIDQALAVQRQRDVEDNGKLLEAAAISEGLIAGCVTWIPVASGKIRAYLDEDSHRPLVRGYQEAFAGDMAAADLDFDRGVKEITLADKSLELFTAPARLPEVIAFADRHPGQRLIVDFGVGGKQAALPAPATWARQIRELARRPQVYHRLSSLKPMLDGDTEVRQAESVRPYFDTLLNAFTPERIIFGSGWDGKPGGTSYPLWLSTVDNLIHALSDTEKDRIYRHNAEEFYRLGASA